MKKAVLNGFTLVELLVVIAIMGLVGMYVLANYGSFGEDQKLKSAVLDIANLLKTAQTNASTNMQCPPSFNTWLVEFTDSQNLNLKCGALSGKTYNTSSSLKPLPLPANFSYSVSSGDRLFVNCSYPALLSFAPLSGAPNPVSPCSDNKIMIILTNNKNSHTSTIFIERGGRIYVQ